MKVSKSLLGRYVEIQWMDPNYNRADVDTLLKGRGALATWKERGVVYDITDGVVLIAHSESTNAGNKEPDEIARTAIHEALIESITVYQPENAAGYVVKSTQPVE